MVVIQTIKGAVRVATDMRCGHLVVHRSFEPADRRFRWAVTHAPSGLGVVHVPTREIARGAARRLSRVRGYDWSLGEDGLLSRAKNARRRNDGPALRVVALVKKLYRAAERLAL